MGEISLVAAIAEKVADILIDWAKNNSSELSGVIETIHTAMSGEPFDIFEKVNGAELSVPQKYNVQDIRVDIIPDFETEHKACNLKLRVNGSDPRILEGGFAMLCIRCGSFNNWKVYRDAGYALTFDAAWGGSVSGAKIEFKNKETGNAPFLALPLENGKNTIVLSELDSVNKAAWMNMTEVCFTVTSENYNSEETEGILTVRDFKLVKA